MRRLACATAAAVALLWGVPAATARPFTVDDLLHQESLGAQAIDPTGRWLAFEQRGPYDSAKRYDQHFAIGQTLGRLRVVDLRAGAPARPLLAEDPGSGLVLGPFSPSGERVAVFDARDHGWRLGIVTVATGAVRWFDITPQEARRGRALQWLSDRGFVVFDRPDGWPPADLRQDWQLRERLTAAWASAASGAGAHTVLGSGAYAGVRVRAPARRLLKVDAVTGETAQLTSGEFIDMELSPAGDRVALFRSGRDLQPRPDGPVRGPAGFELEATHLSVLDLRTGKMVELRGVGDLLPNLLAWSPSGRRLLVFERGADGLWPSGGLVRVEADGGEAVSLGRDLEPRATLNPVSIRAGWMGEDPILYGRPRGGGRFDWFRFGARRWVALTGELPAGDQQVLAVGPHRLVVLVGERIMAVGPDGRSRVLGRETATLAIRPFPGTPGSRLVNALPTGTWVRRRRGDDLAWVTDGAIQPGPAPRAEAGEPVMASAAAGVAVMRRLEPTGVETVSVVRTGAPPHPVLTVNANLAETDIPEIVAVRHRGAAGEPLTSWMYLPRRAPGDPLPPLIVRPYLGYSHASPPRELYMEQGFFQNLRMLTGHGYAVLVPSLPNPPGGMIDPADRVAERILAVMAAAEAEPSLAGRFDGNRAAILGWSFGGYTTMAAITQTDRFRAAVALDGISDLVAYWSTMSLQRAIIPEDGYSSIGVTGTVESTQPRLGAPPWVDPDRYHRNSPLLAANRIRTPLLLIHGALDPISMAGSQAMYSALFRQGKDAQLVIYWGANHAVTAPGDVRDVWARTFRFLDEHLSPASATAPRPASPEPASANSGPTPPPPRR